jgi:hypothetical protein
MEINGVMYEGTEDEQAESASKFHKIMAGFKKSLGSHKNKTDVKAKIWRAVPAAHVQTEKPADLNGKDLLDRRNHLKNNGGAGKKADSKSDGKQEKNSKDSKKSKKDKKEKKGKKAKS